MAEHTLQTGLPMLALRPGMQLRLEAISPTTGAAISGVTVTDWAIYAYDVSAGEDEERVPHWVAEEV